MKAIQYSEDTPFEKVAIFIGRCIYALAWLLPLVFMIGFACLVVYKAIKILPTIFN